MRPGENRWKVLTEKRTEGPVLSLAWSRDSRLVYFYRPTAGATFSVPALGGEERLVAGRTSHPEALTDGTLIAERTLADGRLRLVRVWPDEGRDQEFGPPFADLLNPGLRTGPRAFADLGEVVYFGQPAEGNGRGEAGLYAIDLATGASRRLAPGLVFSDVRNPLLPAFAADLARR